MRHRKIIVSHLFQPHETRATIATFEWFSDLPNIAGDIGGTHLKIKTPKVSAVDWFSRYKLNNTWPRRDSWNVNLGTVIVVFWVRIAMHYTEVGIFHLYRLIAAQLRNNFGGLRIEILRPKIEVKFSWLRLFFKSWRVNWQICQISRLTKICPWGLVSLDKIWGNWWQIFSQNLPSSSGPSDNIINDVT